MEPKILEGPYAYHAYIGFAKQDKEIVLKFRRQLENGGVSCSFRATDVAVQSSILDGVKKSQRCLLFVTSDYIRDQWYQMETEAVLQKAERFCRDMVMILKINGYHEVPEKLRGFREILITPERLRDERNMAHLIGDIVREPNVSLAVLSKQNFGYALAFSYFYGYLRLVLPDFKRRLVEETLGKEEELVKKAIKKMLIIMPESCFCPPSMTRKGKIEFTDKYVVRVGRRAGKENCDFKSSLYKLIARDDSEYYFVAELASPLLSMYETYSRGLSGMTRDQLYVERDVFYFTLKSILNHPDNSECHSQFRLLYWSDPETTCKKCDCLEQWSCMSYTPNPEKLNLYEFLHPVLQQELEEERANERYDLRFGSYDNIRSPRSNELHFCSFVNVNGIGSNPARVYDGVISYPMDKRPRGICLIINIENFYNGQVHLEQRKGAKRDAEVLENLFKVLHFDVRTHNDITEEVLELRFLTTQSLDHSNYDAFVCCILTHGKLGAIYTSDGKPVEILRLVEYFTDWNCPSLKGKPKMFFIQACQTVEGEPAGGSSDTGTAEESTSLNLATIHQALYEAEYNTVAETQQAPRNMVDGAPPAYDEIMIENQKVPNDLYDMNVEDAVEADVLPDGHKNKAVLVPGHPDFLMSYSTLPGAKSYRNTNDGSFYIQALNIYLRKGLEIDRALKNVTSWVKKKITELRNTDRNIDGSQLPFHLTSGMDRTIYL